MENEEMKNVVAQKAAGVAAKIAAKNCVKFALAPIVPAVSILLVVVPAVAGKIAEIAVKKSQEKKNDDKNKSFKRTAS